MEPVQQEGEIRGRLRCEPVVLEPHVVAHGIGRFPAETEGRIGSETMVAGAGVGRWRTTVTCP
jgi:hypothetical protein